MSQLAYRMRDIALGLIAVVFLIFAFASQPIVDVVRALANFWVLGLVAAAGGTLIWFFYRVFLRRWWRVRRIANIRLRRMLEEAESERLEPKG
jgi:hypothetical protein